MLFEESKLVQVMSCDEAYIDITKRVSEIARQRRSDDLIAISKLYVEKLKQKILSATGGCTASIGVSRNKLLAKMATSHAKTTEGKTAHSSCQWQCSVSIHEKVARAGFARDWMEKEKDVGGERPEDLRRYNQPRRGCHAGTFW